MCGICGFVGSQNAGEEILLSMMSKIIHRGPDSDGLFFDGVTGLGFRRLCIIDIEDGSQPIYNEDKTLVLIFNGEIYNYQALRGELISKGHSFYTHTDSEVLVHGYEEYGAEMLNKLRGMFGFAIYNKVNKELFIARDFFGIKPVYYYKTDDEFVFGSEIKSILEYPGFEKKLNENALQNYLSFQYSVPDETFFEGIYCLPPAHYLLLKNGQPEIHRYWSPDFNEDKDLTLDEAVDEIDRVFTESVSAHRISDVEVGCFLSSGVDSSFVASFFGGQKAFTVGFDNEKYNEISYAVDFSKVANLDHTYKVITPEEYWDSIGKVQWHMDQPHADPSCIALYFVSKIAAEQVTVVLSGEGADELFGGYGIYHEPLSLRGIRKLPRWLLKAMAGVVSVFPDFKGKNFIIRASKRLDERFIGNANMFSLKEKQKILKNKSLAAAPQALTKPFYDKVTDKDDITKMQYLDIHLWMVGDILLKADRMSMAHSLELRVPFLDKEVFRVASRLKTEYRCNDIDTKYAMRLAAKRHIPEKVASKKKLGFPVPTRVWLREEKYYNIVKEEFLSDTAKKYFNTDKIMKYLDAHFHGKKDYSRKIWTIYIFLVWYKQFFKSTGS